ncbi:MAG: hypothetical protein J6U54_07925 [Clostridiales bacterium]|nr:hypothetical protein [Clostridiales bacterium]
MGRTQEEIRQIADEIKFNVGKVLDIEYCMREYNKKGMGLCGTMTMIGLAMIIIGMSNDPTIKGKLDRIREHKEMEEHS